MGKLGMSEPGLQRLGASLRLVQCPLCRAVGVALGFQGGIQLGNPCLEHRGGVVITTAVQNHDGHAAILHEAMAGTGLIGALLRRCAGGTLQTQGTPHSVFGRLTVVWGQGEIFV